MKYRIVSDSSSNVFDLDRSVDYCTTPLKIMVGDTEYADVKGVDIEDLVNKIEASNSNSTSCPSIQEWMDAYEGVENVFAVTISSSLSGSYNSAMSAREMMMEENPNAKIHVFDSLATGGSMELLIEKIADCCEANMEFDEIVKEVNAYHQRVKILFSLESVKNLAKNGRMLKALADLANKLGIRLIGKASEQGTIQQAHITKGAKRALAALYNEIIKMGYKGGKMRINQCLNLEAATKLKNMLLEKFPSGDIRINMTTALCSYYAERGGLIVGFEI